jgi:hypothetical protein
VAVATMERSRERAVTGADWRADARLKTTYTRLAGTEASIVRYFLSHPSRPFVSF